MPRQRAIGGAAVLALTVIAVAVAVAVAWGLSAALLHVGASAPQAEPGVVVAPPGTTAPSPTVPSPTVPSTTAPSTTAPPAGRTPATPPAGRDADPFDMPLGTSARALSDHEIVVLQRQIAVACMAEKGFDYPLEPSEWASYLAAHPEVDREAAELALWGDATLGEDYRWEDGGCAGYAVHATGQDDAN